MLLAARGWSELSAELQSAAAGFASLTSGSRVSSGRARRRRR
ncbi:hypothetical protein I551_4108 [Mycobacterium ulcerans str. Harvey]|uniref:Uncharacterized protein n=1 Tax=Mycobacterium ulcerans str. Harvey TaxID=1299332 RepID=A0ABN0QXG2_MYCUL|nr:hypothetical protein I551_4108 [Mycobacterium ulcerans str. Harvey]